MGSGGLLIHRFDHRLAQEILEDLPLAPENRRLADYWLSLWQGDALPRRSQFSPSAVRDLLPGIMIHEVQPGLRVSIRLCGTAINQAFGRDLTGCDLIAISPDETRAVRLARHSEIAQGAIGFGLRRGLSRLGVEAVSEELHLPFGDITPDGARMILFHSNWRARDPQPTTPEVPDVLGSPVETRILPLWRS